MAQPFWLLIGDGAGKRRSRRANRRTIADRSNVASGWPSRFWLAVQNELWALWTADKLISQATILFGIAQLGCSLWDLPTLTGWENDGVAPRDFITGIVRNLSPGDGHRYPLFHNLALGILTAPIFLGAAIYAFLCGLPIVAMLASAPTLTAVALVAKALTISMTCIGLLVLGRVARQLFSSRASRWAVLFAMTNVSVAYYGRSTNLDMPYLVWSALAVDRLLTLRTSGDLRNYRLFALFVAFAIATKDQAYSVFVLTVPLYLILLPKLGARAFAAGRAHFSRLLSASALGVACYAVLAGVVINPMGFWTRVSMAVGPNSQDLRHYQSNLSGLVANWLDLIRLENDFFWPWPIVIAGWLGVFGLVARRSRDRGLQAAWQSLPLVAGLSSILTFTLVVARAEHRFVLPLGFWLSAYVGAFIDTMQRLSTRSRLSAAFGTACGVLLLLAGLARDAELAVTQFCDVRYGVERYLASLPGHSRVETYGRLIALPRFDLSARAPYSVTHVAPTSIDGRPRLPGLLEQDALYGDIERRKPDVIVIPEQFAERFLPRTLRRGEALPEQTRRYQGDPGALRFFSLAVSNELPCYHQLTVGQLKKPAWFQALGGQFLKLHGSTGYRVFVLERNVTNPACDPGDGDAVARRIRDKS